MMRRLTRYGIGLVIAILIVVLLRLFCVGSYHISTNSMGESLQKGDFVLVNKILGRSNPERNRVVLYKSPLRKDHQAPPLFLSRCMGMPGDTIEIANDGYRVNGRLLPNMPMTESTFRIRKNIKEPLIELMEDLNIPFRNVEEDSLNLTIRLTNREELRIRDNLSHLLQLDLVPEQSWHYAFAVPTKGMAYRLDSTALFVCREAIMEESGGNAVIRDGKLYVDGKETTFFFFQNDYYWMLSDNEDEAVDSRHLGLIPRSSIVGNVWFCWFSKDAKRRFKRIE